VPSTGSPVPGRRVNPRAQLKPPVEARLVLGDESVEGWIVDQQEDGIGMRFGAGDAVRLLARPDRWRDERLELALPGLDAPWQRLPVALVHVTQRDPAHRECLVGLVYDKRRMKPDQVQRLLETWHAFEGARR
jgi:hypothetical protein